MYKTIIYLNTLWFNHFLWFDMDKGSEHRAKNRPMVLVYQIAKWPHDISYSGPTIVIL